jgi:hypothetical protein
MENNMSKVLYILKKNGRVCPNKKTKYPPAVDSPANWIRAINNQNLHVFDIHGYTISYGKVTKIMYLFEYLKDTLDEPFDVHGAIKKTKQNKLIPFIKLFSEQLKVDIDIVFIPYEYPSAVGSYSYKEKLLYSNNLEHITYVKNILKETTKIIKYSLDEFKVVIHNLRGYSYKKVKNLKSADTLLECYMANETYDPWPGDLDGVLYEGERLIAILEYKTHNLPTPIDQQGIGKYPDEDKRRFKVIQNLQVQLKTDTPLIYIVWGEKHDLIKMDKIMTVNNQARVVNTILVKKENNSFVEKLLKLIKD